MNRNRDSSVLYSIVADPKVTNSAIAADIGLSAAGVGKIRTRLETSGMIRGYAVDVDPHKLGLGTFTILHLRVTDRGWRYRNGLGIQHHIAANPNLIRVYRVSGRDVTHIALGVFRNLEELDRFLHVIRAQLSDYLEVLESFVFSSEGIIKDSMRDLALKVIEEGEDVRMPEPTLFGWVLGEDV